MDKKVCAKCGADEIITVNTPNNVDVNTINSDSKIIVITNGTEIMKEATGGSSTKIAVCKKCSEVVIGE